MSLQARLDIGGPALYDSAEHRKIQIFMDDQDRETLVKRMAQLALQTKAKIYAWSLMIYKGRTKNVAL